MLADQLRSALQARKERKTLRKLTLHSTAAHQHNAFIQNQDPSNSNLNLLSSNSIDSTSTSTSNLIDFSSNDYLSIATSPTLHSIFSHKIKQDMQRGFRLGSSGSRLLDGNSLHHLHVSLLPRAPISDLIRLQKVYLFGLESKIFVDEQDD